MRVIQIEVRLDVEAQSSQLNIIEMHSKECILFEVDTFQESSIVTTWKITLLHTTIKIWRHIKLTSL